MAGGISDVLNLRGSVEASGRAFDETPSQLSYCLVIGVDVISRTVTIKHISSSLEESGVPYLSPSASSLRGEDFIPVIGDVGVVGITSNGSKLIIGFMGGANRSGELVLKQGDMLWKSLGDSIIKQDADGNIFLMTVSGAHVLLTKEGSLKIMSSDLRLETDLSEKFEGKVGDFFTAYEKYYRYKDELMDNSVEGILSVLSGEYEMETWGKYPVVEVHKGTRLNNLGVVEAIEDVPLVYSLEVNDDQDGTNLAYMKIDEAGNIFLSGTTVNIPGFEGGGSSKVVAEDMFSSAVNAPASLSGTSQYQKFLVPLLPKTKLDELLTGVSDAIIFNFDLALMRMSRNTAASAAATLQHIHATIEIEKPSGSVYYTSGTYALTNFMSSDIPNRTTDAAKVVKDGSGNLYLMVMLTMVNISQNNIPVILKEANVYCTRGDAVNNDLSEFFSVQSFYEASNANPSGYSDHTDTGVITKIDYTPTPPPSYKQKGSNTFNTTSGRTITLTTAVASTADYSVYITPTSNPAGYLGEIWVTKTTTNFTVYCSGSTTTTTFDYIVF